MKKYGQGVFKAIAMRGIVVAIPVAMASAYASNLFVPVPPRIAAYEYQQVAEITTTPSTVGIAASTLYGQTKAQIDAQLDEMQALGVENIRVFVPWGLIEISDVTPGGPNQYYWNLLDTVMTAAKERNMGVLAEINSTPYWGAADGSTSFSGTSSPNIAAYAAFVSDFVAKYGDVVSAYEIWNEPNAVLFSNPVDPAAYAALVKAAYLAIKPTDPTKPSDPTATVIAGAVGHVINFGNLTMDPVDFVQAMIAADPTIGNYFDALSYHPYDETMAFSAGNVPANSSYFASDTAYNQVKDLMALFHQEGVAHRVRRSDLQLHLHRHERRHPDRDRHANAAERVDQGPGPDLAELHPGRADLLVQRPRRRHGRSRRRQQLRNLGSERRPQADRRLPRPVVHRPSPRCHRPNESGHTGRITEPVAGTVRGHRRADLQFHCSGANVLHRLRSSDRQPLRFAGRARRQLGGTVVTEGRIGRCLGHLYRGR